MTILNKKQMSEEDIKLNFITPAIQPGWTSHITMETKITDGRINIKGNMVARSKPKYADYILYLNDGNERIVKIETICDVIFRYAENWIDICHYHDLPRRQYYDGNNRDDRLLYNRLCDDSRADYLLEQHNIELNRRNGQ